MSGNHPPLQQDTLNCNDLYHSYAVLKRFIVGPFGGREDPYYIIKLVPVGVSSGDSPAVALANACDAGHIAPIIGDIVK